LADISLPVSRFAEREFRIGDALNKTILTLSRNLLPFSVVTGIAALPGILIFQPIHAATIFAGGLLLWVLMSGLSQAVVLNAAFEDMRGRPVDMLASFRASWRRFVPVIGVTLVMYGCLTPMIVLFLPPPLPFSIASASLALIVPTFIMATMIFVATPVCVVERLGPLKSLGRSAALTKGCRWRIFGMMMAVWLIGVTGAGILEALGDGVGPTIALVLKVIWEALLGAYNAILVVVIYHDLRVAKEGVGTDQIAAVFE
jgi:hypothetical protein